jgi:hypothetical protein
MVKYAPFPVLTCVSGYTTTTTQRLIETDAQALRSRAQPRVQIVYGQPFRSATLLTSSPFKLRAFGYCPPQVRNWHSGAIRPLFHPLRLYISAIRVSDAFLQCHLRWVKLLYA